MEIQKILLATLVALVATTIPMILLFLRAYMRKSHYENEKHKIELEMFRKSYENSIYSLNDKMALDDTRWKDVNHMLFDASERNIDSPRQNHNNLFLESLFVKSDDIMIEERSAFLLAPINPRFSEKAECVRLACADIGIKCQTADQEFISGPILSTIVRKLLSATVIIAIIDGRNPNVFYELGLAHAFGKPVIMVSGGAADLPFDIQSQRMVLVDWHDLQTSIDKIRKAVSESILWANESLNRSNVNRHY